MTAQVKEASVLYVQWTHRSLLTTSEALTPEQFGHQPGVTSPPIGWHLFHMARWADRLQASFSPNVSAAVADACYPDEVWMQEEVAARWGLEPQRLGFLQTGPGMRIEDAIGAARVGQSDLLEYARRVFALADAAVANLTAEDFAQTRRSILPRFQRLPTGELIYAEEKESDVFSDVLFHISHAGRHLGMIEALRGALFSLSGTASV